MINIEISVNLNWSYLFLTVKSHVSRFAASARMIVLHYSKIIFYINVLLTNRRLDFPVITSLSFWAILPSCTGSRSCNSETKRSSRKQSRPVSKRKKNTSTRKSNKCKLKKKLLAIGVAGVKELWLCLWELCHSVINTTQFPQT